jgi:hypothetical protein
MAIQYPKHQHITLPSIEQWGTNANILRDPPKAIFTRRIDKVGQNTDITDLIDASGDRACEGINYYARGVNPMVSVSYSNNSANAGLSGTLTSTSGATQASLPHKIMEGGVFRPPVRTERELLPLSRLPRVWFNKESTPSLVDYSKTKQQPYDYRAVKKEEDIVRVNDVRPNKSANLSTKIVEHFKVLNENAINDKHINVEASAGHRSRDITSFTRDHVDRGKGINHDYTGAFAQSASTRNVSHNLENLAIDQRRYIQDHLSHEGHTNPSMNRSQGLDNMAIDKRRYIQDHLAHEERTNPSRMTSQGLDNLSIDQRRYIQDHLAHEERTNPSMMTSQGLDNLSIDQRRYIQDHLAHEERTNPSMMTSQGLDNLSIDQRRYIQDHLAHEERTNPSRITSQGLDNLSIDQRRYIQDHLAHEERTNPSRITSQGLENLSIDQKRYIHELLQAEQNTNRSRDINVKTIDQLYDNGRMTVKDMIQYETEAGINPGYTFLGEMAQPVLEESNLPQHERTTQLSDSRVYHRVAHEKDLVKDRNTPLTQFATNVTKLEDLNSMNLSSREARLAATLQKGSFHNVGNKPTYERKDQIDLMAGRESDKDRLRKSVNQQFSRFDY